jgi:predicted  nucleic acid-binding Zn-ribbon protein
MYFSYPLFKENTKLAFEIRSLKENLKEKEEQFQVLGVQKASLETSLVELTAEAEEDKKQIEDKWKKVVENIRSLLEHSQVVSGHTLHNIYINSL